MFGKILLGIRVALPFALNILLFKYIYDFNKGADYALTDSLFYVGIISFLYGLGTIYLFPRENYILRLNPRNTPINSTIAEQHIRNYHRGKKINFSTVNITSAHIKLIYIFLGALFCISSAIVYFI